MSKELTDMVVYLNNTVDNFLQDQSFRGTFSVLDIIEAVKREIVKNPSVLNPKCKAMLNATSLKYVFEDMKYNIIYTFIDQLDTVFKQKFSSTIYSEYDIPSVVKEYYTFCDTSDVFNVSKYFEVVKDKSRDTFVISEAANLGFTIYSELLRNRIFSVSMIHPEGILLNTLEEITKANTILIVNKIGFVMNSIVLK